MWLDMRIQRIDLAAAIEVLADEPLSMPVVTVDLEPPAAGPEVELTMPFRVSVNERMIERTLREHAVTPLAMRVRSWSRGEVRPG